MTSPSLHDHELENRSPPNPNPSPNCSNDIFTNSNTNSASPSSTGNDVLLRQKVMEDLSKFLQKSSKTVDLIQSRLCSSQSLGVEEVTENGKVSQNGSETCWNVLSSSSSGQHHDESIHLLPSDEFQKDTCNATYAAADTTQIFLLEEETNLTFKSDAITTRQAPPEEADIKAFLEEIRKTYQSWFFKQQNLLQSKTLLSTDMVLQEIEKQAELPDEVLGKNVDAGVQAALNSSTKENCIVFRRSRVKQNKAKSAVKENSQSAGNPNQESATDNEINIVSEDGVTIVNNFVTPNKRDYTVQTKAATTKWNSKGSDSDVRELQIQQYQRTVEIIDSPDWLPEGWITELKTRGSGNSAGTKDKYYVEPITKRRFRSRKEVIDFLETGKSNRQRKRTELSPMRRIFEGETIATPAKHPSKRTRSRENINPRSMVHPSMSAPNGRSRNANMAHMTGQPSEWLLYESLANLPFPMFDPFRYGQFNSNKSNSSQSSSMPQRPWFFTGPDTSWMPFMGKHGEKGRDYQSSYMAPSAYRHTSEPGVKKTGRNRKSSKKNSK